VFSVLFTQNRVCDEYSIFMNLPHTRAALQKINKNII
jgi:hypothetical protein